LNFFRLPIDLKRDARKGGYFAVCDCLSPQKKTHAYYVVESLGGLAGKTRNLHIRGSGTLSGQTKKGDGSWTTDQIDLGRHIVNHDGRFRFFRSQDRLGFPYSASELSLEGTRLDAMLNKGTSSTQYKASLELELVLRVDPNGKFIVITPFVYYFLLHAIKALKFLSTSHRHERARIIYSVSHMFLDNDGGVHALHGFCLDEYCKLEYSSIALNSHYRFIADAKELDLEVTPTQVLLKADGRERDDLNINIENQMGRFVYVRQYVQRFLLIITLLSSFLSK
jgi:hypothetical protein